MAIVTTKQPEAGLAGRSKIKATIAPRGAHGITHDGIVPA